MLKRRLRLLLRRFGYDVSHVSNPSALVLFDALRRILDGRSVPMVIDVGANRGQFRDFLRDQIGFAGRIVSFEPSPTDYAVAAKKAENDPLWTVHPWALGAEEGSLPFHVTSDTTFSSFLTPKTGNDPQSDAAIIRTVNVRVRSLDDALDELGLDATHAYLKCDTQGYDLEVMRGAAKTLPMLAGLQSEVSVLPLYHGTVGLSEALDEMRGFGFEIAAMAPVNFDRDAVIEFDCVMVNRADAV